MKNESLVMEVMSVNVAMQGKFTPNAKVKFSKILNLIQFQYETFYTFSQKEDTKSVK